MSSRTGMLCPGPRFFTIFFSAPPPPRQRLKNAKNSSQNVFKRAARPGSQPPDELHFIQILDAFSINYIFIII
jgi:hypothetical protein